MSQLIALPLAIEYGQRPTLFSFKLKTTANKSPYMMFPRIFHLVPIQTGILYICYGLMQWGAAFSVPSTSTTEVDSI